MGSAFDVPAAAQPPAGGAAGSVGLGGWWWVIALWVPAVLVQSMLVACLCHGGSAKVEAAFWASVAVLARGLIAVALREQSRWWVAYVSLYAAIPFMTLLVAGWAGFD